MNDLIAAGKISDSTPWNEARFAIHLIVILTKTNWCVRSLSELNRQGDGLFDSKLPVIEADP